MTNLVTLVFPALGTTSADYLTAADQRGEKVVCAASVRDDDFPVGFGPLHTLPSINDAIFETQLLDLVKAHGITHAYCPVSTVYAFLDGLIRRGNLDLRLIGKSPVQLQIDQHYLLMAKARRLHPFAQHCANGARPSIGLIELAGVLRFSSLIYGESNENKLAAMMGVFASAPKGDVVEIGSLMGRSASVLIYLAWRYHTGPILTIDPWSARECAQLDSPDSLQLVTDAWDYEVLQDAFYLNLVPMRTNDHAHLRLPSVLAYDKYIGGTPIESMIGQPVEYERSIAVIHIDGNHDYQSVKTDCELWLSRLLPGAWLILDDYIWAHGDGPYRVGNTLLQDRSDAIEQSFVSGKALFVKFK
ncbi:MAG: class I SAM-dependent methyltransferase [Rhodocyclaceae bacterium]|jgi:hypothetical protein|nr:class I SAM-dependent methyltransferase [Rhodocyclaceae bacterium]MCA3051881.1 class I SAM-dependent methyltransferase [Rhodocyclaceae bacterium]